MTEGCTKMGKRGGNMGRGEVGGGREQDGGEGRQHLKSKSCQLRGNTETGALDAGGVGKMQVR